MNQEIKYYHRAHGQIEVEKVYGDWLINFLYDSPMGKKISHLLTNKYLSNIYGALQNLPISSKKVAPFVKKFGINMDEFQPGSIPDDKTIEDSYLHFNEFFIRKFKLGQRPFKSEAKILPAFAEARYVGHKSLDVKDLYPVKGHHLTPKALLKEEKIAKLFEGGPLLIARLCPVDYHRFHFPDDGEIIESYRIHGSFDSVNPLAIKEKPEIFIENERHVSILKTKNFGLIAYIEVGAICVGKIIQSHSKKTFIRGEEKGYFLFGGSTVVVLGQKGQWIPSPDIISNSQNKMETYVQLGDEVGSIT